MKVYKQADSGTEVGGGGGGGGVLRGHQPSLYLENLALVM